MALADLIARLEREAETRSAELEARAEAEAQSLSAEATRLAAERKERELTQRRRERRARHEAALAQARRQARGARLEAQHALLARVFARARALVPEVARSEAYLALVPEHLKEARRYLEGMKVVVRCPPAMAAGLRGDPATEDVEVVEDAASPAGVTVTAADGSVVIDNTLPARLQRVEARLAVEVLEQVAALRGQHDQP